MQRELKSLLNRIFARIGHHPLHIILGVITVIIGLFLIFDDDYFFWPPDLGDVLNSDFFGTWALFTGLGIIYVAVQKFIPSQANTIWLLSECGFMGTMCGLEISHGLIIHTDGDHLILFGIVLFGMLLFTLDVIKKNGVSENKLARRLRERDEKIKEGR